jgi:hypothetical protein
MGDSSSRRLVALYTGFGGLEGGCCALVERLARSTASVNVNTSPCLRSSTQTLPGSRLSDESERRIGLDVAPQP